MRLGERNREPNTPTGRIRRVEAQIRDIAHVLRGDGSGLPEHQDGNPLLVGGQNMPEAGTYDVLEDNGGPRVSNGIAEMDVMQLNPPNMPGKKAIGRHLSVPFGFWISMRILLRHDGGIGRRSPSSVFDPDVAHR